MTPAEVAAILRQFNEWRRGDYEPSEQPEPPNPYEVGLAIDAAVEMIDRLEAAEQTAQDYLRIDREKAQIAQMLATTEKAVSTAYQRGYATGQEEIHAELDVLRAKIAEMEKQGAWFQRKVHSVIPGAKGWGPAMQDTLMKFDPATGEERPYPSHATQWRNLHGTAAWLFDPWTGKRRNAYDVGSDVHGLLIAPAGTLGMDMGGGCATRSPA